MPKSKPPYPAQFRQQIIELAHAGRTPADLSREFGPTAQSIANWIAQDARDRGKPLPGKEVRIPLIVTDDSGIVTGRSGDRDRRFEQAGHSAV